ncbi:UNVERIFIED_ORG: hypothetical protein ABIC43_000986 [Variovorax guangxiensis]
MLQATSEILNADLLAAVAFFQDDQDAIDLPFIGTYPKNCCESVSTILAAVLAARYPESTVRLVEGYSREKNNYHFWVEVDDQVLDATAHQFAAYPASFVCPVPSPLAMEYPDIEREIPSAALSSRARSLQRGIEEVEKLNEIVARLRSRLAATK